MELYSQYLIEWGCLNKNLDYLKNYRMRLFTRKDYKLTVDPLVYTLKSFKKLDQRDRTVNKSQLEKELSFIYFVYDPRSDLQYIIDEQDRIEKAKEIIGLDSKFKIDNDIVKAVETYISMTETSASLLIKDLKISLEKIRAYLRDAEVDSDTFDKYVRSVERLIPISQKISETEGAVIREVAEISNARGDKAMTLLDGGFENIMG